MPKQEALNLLYMDVADRISEMSHAVRKKVGAVVVKDDNIISFGWNGTAAGDSNECEDVMPDGTLVTKSTVLHAELNALMKLSANGGVGCAGSSLYVTLSPCGECAKLIKQAKIKNVFFREKYRDDTGINFLKERGVDVVQVNKGAHNA